jgi:hypothetical protein
VSIDVPNFDRELQNVFDEARNVLTDHLKAGGDVLKGSIDVMNTGGDVLKGSSIPAKPDRNPRPLPRNLLTIFYL